MIKTFNLYSSLKTLGAFITNKTCAVCQCLCTGLSVCQQCSDDFYKKISHVTRCYQCAMPSDNKLCTRCSLQTERFFFDEMVCIDDFKDPLSRLISELKFSKHLELAPWFAQQVCFVLFNRYHNHNNIIHNNINNIKTLIETLLNRYDLIIPIPLHPKRLRERGFNQAWEIIRHLPCHQNKKQHALIRVVDTASQRGLNTVDRANNMKFAFDINPKMIKKINHNTHKPLHQCRILLIDDVVTTSATVNAACRVLKDYGASWVTVATLARV